MEIINKNGGINNPLSWVLESKLSYTGFKVLSYYEKIVSVFTFDFSTFWQQNEDADKDQQRRWRLKMSLYLKSV